MAVKRINVMCLKIEDKPGSLQKLLEQISSVNIELTGFIACSDRVGSGYICISAKDPDALKGFISEKGLDATAMTGFVISSKDRIGAAGEALKGLADAGINCVAGAAMIGIMA